MKIKCFGLAFVILLFVPSSFAQNVRNEWTIADSLTLRLDPQTFPWLPGPIREYLENHDCYIPQAYYDTVPHNVLKGQFYRAGSSDIAVLCSHNRVSSILVFWNQGTDSVSEISKSADIEWLQGIGGDKIGYSRRILVAYSRQDTTQIGSSALDHEAIEDYFEGKSSTIYFYTKNHWQEIAGAD